MTGKGAIVIAPETAIPFTTVTDAGNPNITLNSTTGAVRLGAPGSYQINWWIVINNTHITDTTAQWTDFAVQLDGVENSRVSIADSGTGFININGTAFVTVKDAPHELTLVSKGPLSFRIQDANVQAGMQIIGYN